VKFCYRFLKNKIIKRLTRRRSTLKSWVLFFGCAAVLLGPRRPCCWGF